VAGVGIGHLAVFVDKDDRGGVIWNSLDDVIEDAIEQLALMPDRAERATEFQQGAKMQLDPG
jgi:hypothetical protein